jgi:hypothetical protein
MAKQKTTNGVQKWLERIQRAIEVKKEWQDRFRIHLAYQYLEGLQMPAGAKPDEWITINMYYSILRATLPTLFRLDPYFYVRVKRSYKPDPMYIALIEQKAQARQSMLNYLKQELDLKPKIRLAILDAFFQFGVLKVSYKAEMKENPNKGQIVLTENGTPVLDEDGEPILEPDEIPAREAYVVTRIHPDDFLVDENAGPLEDDVSWMAQRIVMPYGEVVQDKRYNKKARELLTPTAISPATERQRGRSKKGGMVYAKLKEEEAELVVLWEIYDLYKDQWLVVAEGCPEFLVPPEGVPKGIERHPFVFLRFFMRDNSWYPIPPATQWIDAQREYNEIRSKIVAHRKRFNRKYEVYEAGLVDEFELSKLELGEDGTIIRKTVPNPVVVPIADAPLDYQHIQELQLIRTDFSDLAVGPNQRGTGTAVESATEAGILEKRALIQEGDDISQIVDMVAKMAAKLDQLVQTHITRDQAIKVIGPDGTWTWQTIRATDYEEVEGEYAYSINVATMTPQLPELERAQWLAFLTALANAPQLALSRRLLQETARMFHIEDETLVEEIQAIVRGMMQGQIPMTRPQGSPPGMPARAESSLGVAYGINNFRGGGR